MSFIRMVLPVILAVGVLPSCSGDPNQSLAPAYGAPGGVGKVFGTVLHTNGSPRADAEVLVTRCGSPIDGLAGRVRANTQGFYTIDLQFPDVFTFMFESETMVIECTVVADRGFAAETVGVIFTRPEEESVPIRVDLVGPQTE